MVLESIGVLATFLLLCGIGIGPALWLVAHDDNRLAYGFGISPAIGYLILGLIGFPLARYVGPVQGWAVFVTVLLLVGSIVLAVVLLRGHTAQVRALLTRRVVLFTAALLIGCWLILAAPLAVKGIQYSIFRGNPSDAFQYISRAEFLREAPWHTILNGIDLTPENMPAVAELAGVSPTAIFSARGVSQPIALNKPAQLAWFAQVLGIEVYRFAYASNLLAFLVAVPLALILGHQLRLPRLLTFLGAAAIAIGYWARFVLETDAGYEISALPLPLLFGIAWIQLEQEPVRPISRARLLLALAGATLVAFYFPLVLVIVLAFILFYALGLIQRVLTLRALLYQGVTALQILVILGVTGQLDFYWSNTLYLVLSSGNEAAYSSEVMNSFQQDTLGGVWGLPASVLGTPLPQIFEMLFPYLAMLLGVLLTGMLIAAAVYVVRRTAPSAERIIFALLAAGLALMAIFLVRGELRPAGKAFEYVYPFLILGVLIFYNYAPAVLSMPLRRAAYAVLVGWLALQILIGAVIPFTPRLGGIFERSAQFKPEQFNLSPITGVLDQNPPQLLLISVPRTDSWIFSYYTMFALDKYLEYYQSGIILDNNVTPQNLWLDTLDRAPDYAVVLKAADAIGPAQLGTPVAQTADLILYRVTDTDLAKWQAQEAMLKAQEAAKPVFKITLPAYFSYK